MQVSGTTNSKDPIPHGLKGYRKPWECKCSKCRTANTRYNRENREKNAQAGIVPRRRRGSDELEAKREARYAKVQGKTRTAIRERLAEPKATETNVSVRRGAGEMERAVIEECAGITDAKPTLVVAAKNLGRSVDDLTGNAKAIALYNSTMKQLMATMSELRGDKTSPAARATGRRKSGGRLATVGNLTKVKRAQ